MEIRHMPCMKKAPENINVTFPVINGVIADYANMQTMIFEFLEKNIPRERCVEQSLSLPYQLILQRSRKGIFWHLCKEQGKTKRRASLWETTCRCRWIGNWCQRADRCHGCGYRSRYNRDFRHVIRRTGTERHASFWRKPDWWIHYFPSETYLQSGDRTKRQQWP